MRFVNGFHQLRKRRTEPGIADLIAWGICFLAIFKIIGGGE